MPDGIAYIQDQWKENLDPDEAEAANRVVDFDADETVCPACGTTFTTEVPMCPDCGLRFG